ncbi:putative ergosterol 28 [Myxozyma melibiosi]|uniref:Ergosterol 28 n=1 Tax=Myxozyma melibiosi TaxID=54550 RepID=A0ABR1FD65_9ASCO
MDVLSSYLPTIPGLLPKWLLFIAAVSIFNSGQSYFGGLILTRRVYEAKPTEVTGLSARTFGTWTFLTSVVRLVGAYHLTDPVIFKLTYATFVVAFLHFFSEWQLFKTAKLGKGLAGPLIVSTTSMIWMAKQMNYYVSA